MNLCRFDRDRLGIVEDGQIFDVTEAVRQISAPSWPYPAGDPLVVNLDRVVEAAGRARRNARSKPIGEAALYSPVTAPTKLMAAPANYRLHVLIDAQDPGLHHGVHHKELEGVERPVEKFGLFLKASSSIVGPAEGIALNWLDRRNDHEVELAVVIGRTAADVAVTRALDYVAGYMVGLDMTVRGTEDRSFRKSADSYAVLGPWLTTADAIANPEKLTIWLEVNGEERQRSSTAAMTVGIAELIALASSVYTLHPGDVILTGSPEGVGPVVPGDRIRAGCDGIGDMTIEVRAKRS
jgi:2-keto-4-pentenoate hydratase/2-oxohepta-3-ene-1,7-dioic acid hydratase in catechol pathway